MTLNTDNEVAPTSNLMNSDDLRTSVRDVTAENRAKGYFNEASTYIPDNVANNNPDIVSRNGSRVHAGGDYQPNDILMIGNMEVTYEMAQSLGLIQGSEFSSPQEDFRAGAEQTPEAEPVDDRPAEAILLDDQLKLAFGEDSGKVLDVLGNDIVMNGELSERGLSFLNSEMGMTPQRFQETYSEMQDVGGQVMQQFLENGDGLEMERIDFLVDLAETGTLDQQATVRNIWFKAATGQLTRDQAVEAFDSLWEPYDG
ncbi:hypothetical protein [Ruegeria arenilitoris]|uniref:hypothetical protein n=1 Tax=Ruegeria arenilitoris TaxID=1173585 RepID=UPI00147F86F1|nr:hypothetical protein [Ruegeria arenilitoris]